MFDAEAAGAFCCRYERTTSPANGFTDVGDS
jgi:hypothetical protein